MDSVTRELLEKLSKRPVGAKGSIRSDGNTTVFTLREDNQYPASLEIRFGEKGKEYLSVKSDEGKMLPFRLTPETVEPIVIFLCQTLLRTEEKKEE